MAEGPGDAVVSRNSVTTKHPIEIYRVALFADGQTNGWTDTRRQHIPRLA